MTTLAFEVAVFTTWATSLGASLSMVVSELPPSLAASARSAPCGRRRWGVDGPEPPPWPHPLGAFDGY